MQNFNLHEGEAETIRLYLEDEGNLLGTDDWRALEVCKILDINYFQLYHLLFGVKLKI
jgi:predicted nucleic acid-binding protein